MRNFLLLNGFGCSLKIRRSCLEVRTGGLGRSKINESLNIPISKIDFDRILVNGKSGSITFDAIKWLISKRITVVFLDYNGRLLTQLHPLIKKSAFTEELQYKATDKTKLKFGKDIVYSKISKQLDIISWLEEKFDRDFNKERITMDNLREKTNRCDSIKRLLQVEGNAGVAYWSCIKEVIPEYMGFDGRTKKRRGFRRPNNAKDSFNCLLNYSYSVLLSEIFRAIHISGFNPYFGLYHKSTLGVPSFAYDVIEPYRFLVEKPVIENLNMFKQKHFVITQEGIYRLKTAGIEILIPLLYSALNKTVEYKGKQYKWVSIFNKKLVELSRWLENPTSDFTFSQP